MEITVRIEAPGLMEAIMALAEQLQEHNALIAGKPVPTEPITVKTVEIAEEVTKQENKKKTEKEPENAENVTKTVEKEGKSEDYPIETVRALVVSSKANKEKAKEVMTEMGIKKLTDLSQEQLNDLYAKLQEV